MKMSYTYKYFYYRKFYNYFYLNHFYYMIFKCYIKHKLKKNVRHLFNELTDTS